MRWSMLPVSVAAHVAVLVAFLIVTAGRGVRTPEAVAASRRRLMSPRRRSAAAACCAARADAERRTRAAPTVAPDHIAPDERRKPAMSRLRTAGLLVRSVAGSRGLSPHMGLSRCVAAATTAGSPRSTVRGRCGSAA